MKNCPLLGEKLRAETGNKTERQVKYKLCIEHDCFEVGKL